MMLLRMKNFVVLGFTDFGCVCGHEEPISRGGKGCLKRGLRQFAIFKRDDWQETLKYGVGVQPTMAIQETLKYWAGVQQGQSYYMARRCLFSIR